MGNNRRKIHVLTIMGRPTESQYEYAKAIGFKYYYELMNMGPNNPDLIMSSRVVVNYIGSIFSDKDILDGKPSITVEDYYKNFSLIEAEDLGLDWDHFNELWDLDNMTKFKGGN